MDQELRLYFTEAAWKACRVTQHAKDVHELAELIKWIRQFELGSNPIMIINTRLCQPACQFEESLEVLFRYMARKCRDCKDHPWDFPAIVNLSVSGLQTGGTSQSSFANPNDKLSFVKSVVIQEIHASGRRFQVHHADPAMHMQALTQKRVAGDFSAVLCSPQFAYDVCRTAESRPGFWTSTSWKEAWLDYSKEVAIQSKTPQSVCFLDPAVFTTGPQHGIENTGIITAPPKQLPVLSTSMTIVVCPHESLGLGNVVNTLVSAMWLAHHLQLHVHLVMKQSPHQNGKFHDIFENWYESLPDWCHVQSVTVRDVDAKEHDAIMNDEQWRSDNSKLPPWRHFSMAKAQVPEMVKMVRQYCQDHGLPEPFYESLLPFYKLVCSPKKNIVEHVRNYMRARQCGSMEWFGFHVRRGDLKQMLIKFAWVQGVQYPKSDADLWRSLKQRLDDNFLVYVSTDTREYHDIIKGWFPNAWNRSLFFGPAHLSDWCSHEPFITDSHVRETSQFTFMCDVVALSMCPHVQVANESTVKTLVQGVRGKPFHTYTDNGMPEPLALTQAWPCKQKGLRWHNGQKEFHVVLQRAADRLWLLAMQPVTWLTPLPANALQHLASIPDSLVQSTFHRLTDLMVSRGDNEWMVPGASLCSLLQRGEPLFKFKEEFQKLIIEWLHGIKPVTNRPRPQPFLQSFLWYRMRAWSISTYRHAFLAFHDNVYSIELSRMSAHDQRTVFNSSRVNADDLDQWKRPPGSRPVENLLPHRVVVTNLSDNIFEENMWENSSGQATQSQHTGGASALSMNSSRSPPTISAAASSTPAASSTSVPVIDLTVEDPPWQKLARPLPHASEAPWSKRSRVHNAGARSDDP